MGIPAEALLPFIFGNSGGGGGGGGASGDSAFIPSIGSLATISTGTSWSGDDPYTSTVTLTGYTVTGNTMVSVLPSSDIIEQMVEDGTTNIFISNNNGTLTANAIGAAPTAAMTLHVLCTESDASAELGNLPNIVGDGVLETLQATDLTDAINQLSSDLDDAKNAINALEEDVQEVSGIHKTIIPVWTNKKRIIEDGSIVNSGDAFYISDPIDVINEDVMLANGVYSYEAVTMPSIHYYNASGTHIGYSYAYDTFSFKDKATELGAAFIRLSQYANNTHPISGVNVQFETNGEIDTQNQQIENNRQDILELQQNVLTEASDQFVNILTNRESVNNQYLINGVLSPNQNWCSTADGIYIPVGGGKTYAINYNPPMNTKPSWWNYTIAWYDQNKVYLSATTSVSNSGYLAPDHAAYCRLSHPNSNYSAAYSDDFSNVFMTEANSGIDVHCIDSEKYQYGVFPYTTLCGKTWGLFGDSITEHNIRATANYHDFIRVETGIITKNYALGGSGYKNRDDNGNAFYQIAYRNRAELSQCDVITIMGGVNDCTRATFSTILGTPSDVFSGDDMTGVTSNSICACFKKLLDIIIDNAPLAKIAVISPLPAITQGYTFNPSDDTNNMSVFVTAIKDICNDYGVAFLDLYHTSGLRPWDDTVNQAFFLCNSSDSPDRLHPNIYGHKYIYPAIREFMKSLI